MQQFVGRTDKGVPVYQKIWVFKNRYDKAHEGKQERERRIKQMERKLAKEVAHVGGEV